MQNAKMQNVQLLLQLQLQLLLQLQLQLLVWLFGLFPKEDVATQTTRDHATLPLVVYLLRQVGRR
jgi:hypothetical protein